VRSADVLPEAKPGLTKGGPCAYAVRIARRVMSDRPPVR
jgi:hypothetical protein